MMSPKELARFEKFIEKSHNCWIWTSAKNEHGYGQFWFRGKPRPAHHIACEQYKGSRAGLMVLHHCDNPSCVNPAHLYLGTNADNMRDMWTRKRRVGRKPECHPDRRHVGRGMCVACYKQWRKGPRYCILCGNLLPQFKAKLCGPKCFHENKMIQQRERRAKGEWK